MATAWLSVIMDELRSSCTPCGAWFDSPVPTFCCVQACSQTPSYRYMHAHLPHMYCLPPKQPCLFHFIDLLSALSVPWSHVQVRVACMLQVVVFPSLKVLPVCVCRLVPFQAPLPHPPLSPGSCILSSPLCPFMGSVWWQKEKPFYKNIDANLISAHPPPPYQPQSAEGAQRWGGQSINLIKRFRKWRA